MRSTVAGIPCIIEVVSVSRGYAARIHADPDDCYPGEEPEILFRVCDTNGRLAPWLARKITPADLARIETDILNGWANDDE